MSSPSQVDHKRSPSPDPALLLSLSTPGASTSTSTSTSTSAAAASLTEANAHAYGQLSLAEWHPILQQPNQVVLYNPRNHALAIRRPAGPVLPALGVCPYCRRALGELGSEGTNARGRGDEHAHQALYPGEVGGEGEGEGQRAPDYFRLLAASNEAWSRPPSPSAGAAFVTDAASDASQDAFADRDGDHQDDVDGRRTSTPRAGGAAQNGSASFTRENMAEGYFRAFFREEGRLGMGANGSVFLCQHLLDGNPLGYFAVKKIAVGESHSYLLDTLREVRLLEKLHHPNIISYHHAWLENCQFSSFGPKIPTLHLLMQWAEAGSLDDLIDARQGRAAPHLQPNHSSGGRDELPESWSGSGLSRAARIRAFRAKQRMPPEERHRKRRETERERRTLTPVHLLSAEEVKSLFGDVVEGLAFLHNQSILHLDLKPGNVLLTWDEGKLTPRAMLSDFGTSRDSMTSSLRSGNTGTLEYAAPETLRTADGALRQVDSKADLWSLGMLLHKLLFFRLPYAHAAGPEATDGRIDRLEREVAAYPGFKASPELSDAFRSRRLPVAYVLLLENLLRVTPHARPTCERVVAALRSGGLNPLPEVANGASNTMEMLPVLRRASPEFPRAPSPGRSDTTETSAVDGRKSDEASNAIFRPPMLGPPNLPAPSPRPDAAARARRRALGTRVVKSVVLSAKVYQIARAGTQLRPEVAGALLAAATADAWFDGWPISAILATMHVIVMRMSHTDGLWISL